MKTNKTILGIALAVLCLASCEKADYPDRHYATSGLPTVQYVRYADQDILITQAYMDEVVCIVGENLRSINKVFFNDRQAILNTSYLTANTLIVSIPSQQAVEKTDKIYLYNKDGEYVAYDFKVLPPSPKVSSMSLEYAEEGETVTLTGKYFMDVKKVSFTGAEATDYTVTSAESIDVKIPAGAQAGPVYVETESGSAYSKFYYKDERGMLFDFDGKTGLSNCGWHARDIISDEYSLCGYYLQLGDGSSALSNWNDSQYSFEYWAGSWDDPQNITSGNGMALYNLVDFTNFSSMALKFEMMIPSETPWRDYGMHICFEGFDRVSLSGKAIEGYTGTVAGANAYAFNNSDKDLSEGEFGGEYGRAIYKPFEATGSFTTDGKWITVTIPISDFKYNKDGGEASVVPSSYNDFASLTIFCTGASITGTEDADNVPIIKIDNIRVVPN